MIVLWGAASGESTTCSASRCSGLRLAPGADACQAFDIISVNEEYVGAEIFATVTPQSKGKLAKNLLKLSAFPGVHGYVFFMSPLFKSNKGLFSLRRTESRYGQWISNLLDSWWIRTQGVLSR